MPFNTTADELSVDTAKAYIHTNAPRWTTNRASRVAIFQSAVDVKAGVRLYQAASFALTKKCSPLPKREVVVRAYGRY